ncbi:MAG: CDP-diacylglycerol--glycerol-3-phosphate 3-phosphatidyltransferase [Candidatus Marinimicrobia bacterium]|nr:CDP-diacylglycerol--glycerol-3-phosphate 3-phosphatidyltransferase [Candidatus Neomarinimicrobiota bacterium]
MIFTISNILTIIRIILVPIFLALYFSESYLLQTIGTLCFIAGAITDHWDGKLARRRKEITEFGRFWDPLADKFLTLSAFIAIWYREDFNFFSNFIIFYIFVIAVRELWITFLRLWGVSKDKPLVTSFWGKLKTTFQLIAIIFSLVYFNARDILMEFQYRIIYIDDTHIIPVIHFLILISMIVTVLSGVLYFRPSSFERKSKLADG